MLPTSIPRGNVEGCISNDVLREIQGHKQDQQTIPNLKVVPSNPGVSSQQACSVIFAQHMQVELNPIKK